MTDRVLVGLLDSGVDPGLASHTIAGRAFALAGDGEIEAGPATPDAIGHGSAAARLILAAAPEAGIVNAQVFRASLSTTPAAVAAGLDWLVEEGVRLVNLSFGLRRDREVLRQACEAALDAGVTLFAAAPARGPKVYPGLYERVIEVSGDARCAEREVSTLGGQQADFGACPRPLEPGAGPDPLGGASFAAARMTGIAATFLAGEPSAGRDDIRTYLSTRASYHGPERRTDHARPDR